MEDPVIAPQPEPEPSADISTEWSTLFDDADTDLQQSLRFTVPPTIARRKDAFAQDGSDVSAFDGDDGHLHSLTSASSLRSPIDDNSSDNKADTVMSRSFSSSITLTMHLEDDVWDKMFAPIATYNGKIIQERIVQKLATSIDIAEPQPIHISTSDINSDWEKREDDDIQTEEMEGEERCLDYEPYHVLYTIHRDQHGSKETQTTFDELSLMTGASQGSIRKSFKRRMVHWGDQCRNNYETVRYYTSRPYLLFCAGFLFPPLWLVGTWYKSQTIKTEDDSKWRRRCKWAALNFLLIFIVGAVLIAVFQDDVFHMGPKYQTNSPAPTASWSNGLVLVPPPAMTTINAPPI
ncbi:hypothetical protein BZG36_02039 [Bifiguratus adelaidae]|uniref:Uncharacterized protein n=1 Tax=Bifiguratus adelaidae TaxID=1938954 RepID=A0A261Y1V1_9FUNG|nr:hypothetical protein BZG36_02039 [Bifiguratus adelaidae]